MSQSFSRFDALTSLLAGTATVTLIAIAQPAVAKPARQIADIARPVTVQINNNLLLGGSGVIIAKSGNTYTVLTANHVVKRPDLTYTIRTDTGKNYQVTKVQRLQQSKNAPDLALVIFDSPDKYPLATLGNSDQAAIGVDVYVSGYPALGGRSGDQRDYVFSPGIVASLPTNRPQGYTLRYNAVTVAGMSGSPVFDARGRLIGIHGQGESEGSVQSESGEAIAIKTGFNSAIPINTFVALRSQTGLSESKVKVNNTPTGNPQAQLNNPTNAREYYVRGLSRLDLGNRKGAVEDFNQALRLNPNDSPVYYNRGNARNRLGDKQGAIADYTEAIQNNPNFASAYYNRGNLRSRLGYKRAAIADYTEALRLNPYDAPAYYNRGVARYDRGDKKGAIEDYTEAIQLSPTFALAYNNLGKARYDLGDKQGAIKDYTEAIRLSPTFALAYNNLGKARYDLGDKQGAIKDYTQAIRFYPSYATAYHNRGVARYELGDKQGAIKDYNKAIQLNHNYTLAYYNRGVVRTDLGDKQGALKDFQHAANIYQQQGSTAEYQNVLTKIRELQQ